MLNSINCLLIVVFLFVGQLSFVSAQGANTLSGESSVLPGMNYSEVLGLWGAPKEKTEQEGRRMDVWRYDNQLVYFKQGKVIKTESKLNPADEQAKSPANPVTAKANTPNAEQMEGILSEIIGTTNR